MTTRSVKSGDLPDATYWIVPGKLLAGAYPLASADMLDAEAVPARLAHLRSLGIDWFIDLTWQHELPPYDRFLPSPYDTSQTVTYSRRPIKDHGVPEYRHHMTEILDEIDAALAAGRQVYIHCRAGIGRTGMVAGCYLARHCGSGVDALSQLASLWDASGRVHEWPCTPETDEQIRYVSSWDEAGRFVDVISEQTFGPQVTQLLSDRYQGLVLGLALGDALAAPVQYRKAGTFTPLADLLGGGPYDLPRGAWSDDTAIAMILAASLLSEQGFVATDFMGKLHEWQRLGIGSATGHCVGISAGTAKAIAQAKWSGKPYAGSHDPSIADAEPLVRVGGAAAYSLADPARAIELAVDVVRTTHQAPVVLDAARYFAALVIGALQGATRTELTAPFFSPIEGLWTQSPLKPEIAAIAAGTWNTASYMPTADGHVVNALKLAIWALSRGDDYKSCVLKAVNLGSHADVHGALTGQLAGAVFGAQSLPAHWVAALLERAKITATADSLLAAALASIAAE